MENLRQLCIYKLLTDLNKQHLYWEYISAAYEKCDFTYVTEDCSYAAMKSVGIRVGSVREMYEKSFVYSGNLNPLINDNELLA
jgi:hypothetical protein